MCVCVCVYVCVWFVREEMRLCSLRYFEFMVFEELKEKACTHTCMHTYRVGICVQFMCAIYVCNLCVQFMVFEGLKEKTDDAGTVCVHASMCACVCARGYICAHRDFYIHDYVFIYTIMFRSRRAAH
jgi:hypothetical protein